MWIILAFDLPTQSKIQRRSYSQFRKKIMGNGFMQLQYSLYGRHFSSFAKAEAEARKISLFLPKEGHVALFFLTDRQFGMTKNFYGGLAKKQDDIKQQKQSQQLMLF